MHIIHRWFIGMIFMNISLIHACVSSQLTPKRDYSTRFHEAIELALRNISFIDQKIIVNQIALYEQENIMLQESLNRNKIEVRESLCREWIKDTQALINKQRKSFIETGLYFGPEWPTHDVIRFMIFTRRRQLLPTI